MNRRDSTFRQLDGMRRSGARGFTLFEALLATSILAFTVVAILQAVVAGQMQTHEALRIERGVSLAQALMEEITARPVLVAEGEEAPAGAARNPGRLITIYNYHGLTEAEGELRDAAGDLYPDAFALFARSATVQTRTLSSIGRIGDVRGAQVTVTVRSSQGGAWTLTRFVPEPPQ